ncbi:MAG: hypothetical protein WDW38_002810 [Sanguina aurantia]
MQDGTKIMAGGSLSCLPELIEPSHDSAPDPTSAATSQSRRPIQVGELRVAPQRASTDIQFTPVERRGGTQLSTAATPQPDDIEDMDWESGDSGMDESDLQELSCAVDMEVELPARLGFPLLPRVPVRSTTDGWTPQPGGRGILHPSAAAQQRLPRLLLVVDTNVLMCSAARRVVAAIGTLLRPTAKAASLAGAWREDASEPAGLDDSQDMDMEAEWLQAAEEAQRTDFDVIACVPLVVLKELDLIKGRVQRVGHAEVAESRALIY